MTEPIDTKRGSVSEHRDSRTAIEERWLELALREDFGVERPPRLSARLSRSEPQLADEALELLEECERQSTSNESRTRRVRTALIAAVIVLAVGIGLWRIVAQRSSERNHAVNPGGTQEDRKDSETAPGEQDAAKRELEQQRKKRNAEQQGNERKDNEKQNAKTDVAAKPKTLAELQQLLPFMRRLEISLVEFASDKQSARLLIVDAKELGRWRKALGESLEDSRNIQQLHEGILLTLDLGPGGRHPMQCWTGPTNCVRTGLRQPFYTQMSDSLVRLTRDALRRGRARAEHLKTTRGLRELDGESKELRLILRDADDPAALHRGIARFKKLQRIVIDSRTQLTASVLRRFVAVPALKRVPELSISASELDDGDYRWLAKHEGLRVLVLRSPSASLAAGFASLRTSRVTHLRIESCQRVESVAGLAGWKQLRSLELTYATRAQIEAVSAMLPELSGLEKLQIEYCKTLGIDFFRAVAKSRLRTLAVDTCRAVPLAGLAELKTSKLRALSLHGCDLKDDVLDALVGGRPKSLRSLDLRTTLISAKGKKWLEERLNGVAIQHSQGYVPWR